MGDNNKSSISLVIETIICVLLVGVLIFGGILVYKNSNNSSNNTNSIAQTDNNEKVKDKTEDEEDKPSTTVNITNNTHQEVINPDSSPKTVCGHCETENNEGLYCKSCGKSLDEVETSKKGKIIKATFAPH